MIYFDIIIDDANHKLSQQIKNVENYLPYVRSGGMYICEDVQTNENAKVLVQYISESFPGVQSDIVELDVEQRSDDRLVVVKVS
ncbi:hypothetical protein EB169_13275 [archaeon]|nr:hypothetical protein [archaeon]